MIHPSDGETDGQTNGRAIAYTRYSIYAVARKNVINIQQLHDNFQNSQRFKLRR